VTTDQVCVLAGLLPLKERGCSWIEWDARQLRLTNSLVEVDLLVVCQCPPCHPRRLCGGLEVSGGNLEDVESRVVVGILIAAGGTRVVVGNRAGNLALDGHLVAWVM
jgi:hypothetical protein